MTGSIVVRKSNIAKAVFVAFVLQGAAHAADPVRASVAASQASAASVAEAGSVLVEGSLSALMLAGTAVVASVETVGEGSVVVLQGASDAGGAVIRVAGGASLAVGTVVGVVAYGTGCALMSAGRMVAFVPNEIGRSLVHQSRTTAMR